MDFRNTLELCHRLSSEKLGIIYLGPINDNITDAVIDSNVAFLSKGRSLKSKRRFSVLLAESLQNLIKHGVSDCENPNIFFLTSQIDYTFTVVTINRVSEYTKTLLEKRIAETKEMDKNEMRTKFVDLLKSAKLNRKGGAGLGLFEIVRKSDQKASFWFKKQANDIFHFILKITVGNGQNNKNEQDPDYYSDILKFVKEKHISLIHKGCFLSETYINTSLSLIKKSLALQGIDSSELADAELFMQTFTKEHVIFAKDNISDTSFYCFIEKNNASNNTQLSIYCNIQKKEHANYPQTILLKYPDCNFNIYTDGQENWVSVSWKNNRE
jgi:hypothetical protein